MQPKKLVLAASALAAALSAGVAYADIVTNDIDVSVDATVESMNLTVGGGNGATTYRIVTTGAPEGDPKNGCNFTGGSILRVAVNNSNPAAATVSTTTLTFDACNDTFPLTVTPVAAGSATISLSEVVENTPGTFDLAPATFSVTVTIPADVTAPVIVPTVTPAPNGAGWNSTDVTVTWSVTDAQSTVTSSTGCGPTNLTSETSGTVVTCSATSAGGTASQSVTVKIDKTAPTLTGAASPAPNGAGWNSADVDVSFDCADTGSVQSGIATDTVDDETLSDDGAGQSVTSSGSCVDAAGNSASAATVSGINIDQTAPTIEGSASPAANGNGWNSTDVTVSFTCSDDGSGIVTDTVAGATVTTEGEDQEVTSTGECVDAAGNSADPVTVDGISIDKTAPTLTGAASPAPNGAGWNSADVTVAFDCQDSGSGVDVDTVADVVLSTEGAAQSVTSSGTCVDMAGNVAGPATVSGINIDKTAPDVSIVKPADGGTYTFHQTVLANWSATDAFSGIASAIGTVASGVAIDTSSLGGKTFTVTATDVAGNVTVATADYEVVPYIFGGFKTPVTISAKDFKKMSTVPVKFTIVDPQGNSTDGAVATLKVNGVPAVSSGGSNVGNSFRFDPVALQYIFNLSTKQLSLGANTLLVTLDDGQTRSITITIR